VENRVFFSSFGDAAGRRIFVLLDVHARPNLREACRAAVCLVLVGAILGPDLAAAQPALSSGSPEPRAPTAPPPQHVPPPPPLDAPGRSPTGPIVRPDPCFQGIIAAGQGRIAPGPEYRLGPGDMLDVQIAGRMESTRQQVIVDPEGLVTVPPIGTVPVAGLALRDANRRLSEQARALLRYGEVTLAVTTPRCFEVVLAGEVQDPGVVHASAVRRVHELILAAGGVTPRGSLRRVEVTRRGTTTEIDLLRFELQGDRSQNPFVEEGMVIHVPPRGPSVTLTGAVRRPGEFELGPDRSLRELLELTGGLAQNAAPGQARLTRVGPDGRKETISVDLAAALTPPADVTLAAGDLLFVPSLTLLQDVVEVRGAFNGTPESSRTLTAGKTTIVQRFELAAGDRVKDLVGRAGGAAAYAALRLATIDRAGDGGPRQRIPVDLHRLLVEKDETQDIRLENGDVLTLPVAEDKVYVLGEVRTPGAVDFRPEFTVREYLAAAGGPTVRGRFQKATVTLPNGRSYLLAEAPPVEPGSVITVPEVSVRWYQDYLAIATAVSSLITAYTGLFILFGGRLPND
jgi:protein involved in polysaccharide export with SLBB domain